MQDFSEKAGCERAITTLFRGTKGRGIRAKEGCRPLPLKLGRQWRSPQFHFSKTIFKLLQPFNSLSSIVFSYLKVQIKCLFFCGGFPDPNPAHSQSKLTVLFSTFLRHANPFFSIFYFVRYEHVCLPQMICELANGRICLSDFWIKTVPRW